MRNAYFSCKKVFLRKFICRILEKALYLQQKAIKTNGVFIYVFVCQQMIHTWMNFHEKRIYIFYR